MKVIGIDPGLSGALALIDSALGLLEVVDIPVCSSGLESGLMRRWVDTEELLGQLATWSLRFEFAASYVEAAIERPIAMPGMPNQTIASTFDTVGVLRMLLRSRRIPVVMVAPIAWKRRYGLKTDKDESRTIATRLYPQSSDRLARKKDHNRAESILIADWMLQEINGKREAVA